MSNQRRLIEPDEKCGNWKHSEIVCIKSDMHCMHLKLVLVPTYENSNLGCNLGVFMLTLPSPRRSSSLCSS
jgi:hypothetical protein